VKRVGVSPLLAFLAFAPRLPRCREPNLLTGVACDACDWCIEERIRELDALNGWKSRAVGFSTDAAENARRRALSSGGAS
jgi:hypothetical protein